MNKTLEKAEVVVVVEVEDKMVWDEEAELAWDWDSKIVVGWVHSGSTRMRVV